MRPSAALPLVLALCALAACAAPVGATSSAATPGLSLTSPSCRPKSTTVDGKTDTRYCGPATATLLLGGRTYRFRYGRCNSDQAIGLTLGVTLGSIDYGHLKSNGGRPLFQLQIDTQPVAIETVNASWGGKPLVAINTVTTTDTGQGQLSGTFRSSKGAFDDGKRFSGSWDCGGKIYAD
jgi:hypothetical protein